MDLIDAFIVLEEQTTQAVLSWITAYGGFGILFGMFLESSIVPIPSEAVLVTAGMLGFPPLTVAIWGSIGSTLGSIVGYYIGKKGGRPIIDKLGPYLLITHGRVAWAEKKVKKHGAAAILVSRLIPFIPFKIFSITAGILELDLKKFVLYTFIGAIPRCFVLAWVGGEILKYKDQTLLLVGAGMLVLALAYYAHKKLTIPKAQDTKRQPVPKAQEVKGRKTVKKAERLTAMRGSFRHQ